MSKARRSRPAVHLVTRARSSRYDDIAARQKRYLISMAIRTIAVLLAFFAPLPVWGIVVALTLGLVLPWVSVTSANAPTPESGMAAYDARTRELTAGEEVERPRSGRVVDMGE